MERVHEKLRPFECEFCPSKFATLYEQQSHIANIHKNQKNFPCPICAKAFSNSYLKKHFKFVHQGLRPFKCDHCESGFIRGDVLRNHIDKVHLNLKKFQCKICHKSLSNQYLLRTHIKKIHDCWTQCKYYFHEINRTKFIDLT